MAHIEPTAFLAPNDPEQLRTFAESFRKFAERVLGATQEGDLHFKRSDFSAMGAAGLTGASGPGELGGSNLTPTEIALLIFELSRAQLGPAVYLSVHLMTAKLLHLFGAGKTKDEILGRLINGDHLGAFCLTEAEAGSDAAAIRTKAVANADGFILNGEKIYITSAGFADEYLVFARTSDDLKRGISAFIIPADAKGMSFGPPEKKMGCEGSPIATVTLEECVVPKERLVGKVGEGYSIALAGLATGRINIAAAACGLASRALELARAHAKTRVQFGKPIGEFQGIQFMLADMWMKTRASILMTREAAELMGEKISEVLLASGAKCFATDQAMSVTTDAVQILGGAGYLKDYEVERLMRDAKMLQIVEGTNQIQRLVIARELDRLG